MIGLTLAIALVGAVIAFISGPVGALLTYFAVLFYYPQAMAAPLTDEVALSTGRIVILGVLANALFRGGNLRRYRFDLLDLMVWVQVILQGVAFMTNVDTQKVIIGRGGVIFDLIMPYFAMRLLINDKQRAIKLFKWATIGLIPLALMGIIEARTGHNLYSPMAPYFGFGAAGPTLDPDYKRHGLFRASSSFGNYISFGMLFAVFVPLALALFQNRKVGKVLSLGVAGALMIGLISSMSSGPLFSIAVSLGMIALFKWRSRWPIFAVCVVAGLVFMEVFSNRHFYYVLTLFAFDPETAYYRIGLIEEAFGGGMTGHWLFGFGYVGLGPGTENLIYGFRWEHEDLTNIYIRFLAQAGLMALVPYLIINVLYYRRLYKASFHVSSKSDAWMLWCFAAALVGWNISMMTVSAMAQIETLLFMFIGLCANWPQFMRRDALARRAAMEAGLVDEEALAEAPAEGAQRALGAGGSRGRPQRLWQRRRMALMGRYAAWTKEMDVGGAS